MSRDAFDHDQHASSSQPRPGTTMPASRGHALSPTLVSMVWMVLGVTLTLAALWITGLISWPATAPGQASGSGSEAVGLWTCGMHPDVIEDEPGSCPICKMDLVPLATGAPDHDPDHDREHHPGDRVGTGQQLWTCPMHPEILEPEPGSCPICKMDLVPVETEPGHDRVSADSAAIQTSQPLWTCPMHPEILEPEPGSCPICKMDLVPVETEPGHDRVSQGSASAPERSHRQGTAVTIDPVVVQNMNVRTEPAERRDLSRQVRTVGALDYDQDRMVTVTTRYDGFVEKVFVSYVGQPVERGAPLLEVYSPQLVQTQQELLSAARYADRMADAPEDIRRRALSLLEAARKRLGYWDITAEQISTIESSGEVMRTLQVVSPIRGVIMKRVNGLEGMAIRPGMNALQVADLSTLWLDAEVYEHQLPWVEQGAAAEVHLDYLPGETFGGRVRSVEPEVSPTTRTVKLTLEVPNPGLRLRVGMYATVIFDPVVARDAVVVPEQSVIRSGERDIVVVALEAGRFAPRQVELGVSSEGLVQVIEGVDAGELVVTSAQFLIDSESNLRAAIEKMLAARAAHQH